MNILRVLKRVGGHWHTGGAGQATQVDGDKFVCMDQILTGDQCIIYSFGLAADWTFEDQMDLLGTDHSLLKFSIYYDYLYIELSLVKFFICAPNTWLDSSPLSVLISSLFP